MITYAKCGIDDVVLRLLGKLGVQYPVNSLILDIENFFITPVKVFYDDKLYGVLIVRADINRRGLRELVVLHVIAEDGIEIHFNNILGTSLSETALKDGFDIIRIHTGRCGIARFLERWGGKPVEQIFEKDLKQWKIQETHNPQHSSQPAQRQPTQE